MTDDLIEWLTAQIDEDERVARAAVHRDGADWDRYTFSGAVTHSDEAFMHIARHDPARVLREVEAKRRIAAQYIDAAAFYTEHKEHPAGEAEGLWSALKTAAAVYADQPGYRDEWGPE